MKDKILNKIYESRKATGYEPKYIVLNYYTYHKFRAEVGKGNPLIDYIIDKGTTDDVAKYNGIPILIRAESYLDEEYIEIIPNTYN